MNNMGENIIDLICNSCSCDKTEALSLIHI